MRYLPYLIGLAGCFLPDARYWVGGEKFSTSLAGNYSGWSVLIVLLLLALLSYINSKRNKPDSFFLLGLAGIYLLGFALFRAWHTFTLYSGAGKESLATKLGASAMPAEGLILLIISGCWILVNAFRVKTDSFSTRVE